MNFGFGDEQELLRNTTRRYLDSRGAVGATRARLEALEPFDREDWRAGAALGWAAMLVPPELDGGSVTDQPLVDLVALAEELGRVLHPAPFVPTNITADLLARHGTDALRKEHLPAIVAGETVAAWCLTRDGTTNLGAIGVTADVVGDAALLTGKAMHVHAATAADVLVVTALAGEQVVHAVVHADSVGLSTRSVRGLDLTRRFGVVEFEATEAALIPGDGGAQLERMCAVATVLQAAEAVGAAAELFTRTVEYTKNRVQFGRPVGSFQAIKHRLADLHIATEAMRASTYDAAMRLADAAPDAALAVAAAGSYVGDAFAALCGECLQLHGGIGFTWEHDVHLYLRRAKVNQVTYGDPSSHREKLCRLMEAGG